MHTHAQMQRDLCCEVCAAAEAVDAQPAAGSDSRSNQCAVADDAGTQQGSGLLVRNRGRQSVREALVDHTIVRVATIDIPARECRRQAQILLFTAAESAGSVGPGKPWHTDPLADCKPSCSCAELVNDTDHLVP